NQQPLAELCVRLDGLPLALELAAARARILPVPALLERLRQRLDLPGHGPRDLPERQETLRATIAWSYGLLSEPEKRLYWRLAVFAGGFNLEAAKAVSGEIEGDTLDQLIGLVDKHLVWQRAQPDGQPRFGLLETVREYALERLMASGEGEDVARKHATFFLE